jgi:hypothetical protein
MRSRLFLVVLGLLAVTGAPVQAQVQSSPLQWERLSDSPFETPSSGGLSFQVETAEINSLLSTPATSGLNPSSAAILGGVIGAAAGSAAL